MPVDDLPVVLVSAADAAAADAVISELVDKEVASLRSAGTRVWELSNKYYTARVRMCAWPDTPPRPAPPPADAHVIYLAEHEYDGATLERRAVAVSCDVGDGEGEECAVRLAVCAGERREEGGLNEIARTLGYELVYLGESAAPSEGPFPELVGAARAREALHAHPWRGLRMRGDTTTDQHAPPDDDDDFSPFQSYQNGNGDASSDSAGSRDVSPEPSEEECVRRAELLAGTIAAVRGARGAGTRGERAARAEQLVGAFCRALGTDLHRL